MNDLTTSKTQLPDYMREDLREGAENLQRFVKPAYLKVVRDMASRELKSKFPAGTAVLLPNEIVLTEFEKDGFDFTPIFFFAQYCAINPLQLKDLPMIREKTTDRNSPLAKKCLNPDQWYEDCPEDPKYRIYNCEMLNFLFMCDACDVPCVMTFMKGEHRTGRRLATLIHSRRAPIYGTRFHATVGVHHDRNRQYDYFGLDIENADPAIVDQDQYEVYRELHRKVREQHDLIDVSYDIRDDDNAESSPF